MSVEEEIQTLKEKISAIEKLLFGSGFKEKIVQDEGMENEEKPRKKSVS